MKFQNCYPLSGMLICPYCGKTLRRRQVYKKKIQWLCSTYIEKGVKASTALSMIREIVFGVGFALAFPLLFGLDGVLYSMPVSDLLTFLIALYLIRGTYKELTVKEVNENE